MFLLPTVCLTYCLSVIDRYVSGPVLFSWAFASDKCWSKSFYYSLYHIGYLHHRAVCWAVGRFRPDALEYHLRICGSGTRKFLFRIRIFSIPDSGSRIQGVNQWGSGCRSGFAVPKIDFYTIYHKYFYIRLKISFFVNLDQFPCFWIRICIPNTDRIQESQINAYHVDADPYPACHFDADPHPDPACHFDADPDPTFHLRDL